MTKGQEGKGEKGVGKRVKSWSVKAAKGKKGNNTVIKNS